MRQVREAGPSAVSRRPSAVGRRCIVALAAFIVPAGCITNASGSSGAAPLAIPAPDSSGLLSARRLAALPEAERAAWSAYLERSRRMRQREQDSMQAELAAVGRQRMVPAPDVRENWRMTSAMTGAWFASDSGRRLAEAILSYQTPSGGWSKHMDLSKGPRPLGTSYFSETDRWTYIGTLDNGSTTEHIRFLVRAFAATGDARYRDAVLRGLDYLLVAQMPSGCWPQVFPLDGGYRDATTFNDDAIVNVLKVLRDVGRGDRFGFGFVPEDVRARAANALARGVDCLVDSQVIVNGVRTAWGQQHDPLTHLPIAARSYEHASLSGRESAGIAEFLMSLPDPDERVVRAVHAVADWFRATAIRDVVYEYNKGLRPEPGAGPIWARMTEIGTNRPIFSNRDGKVLYDYEQLTDRRTGYGWFGSEPADALRRYESWARRHPRTGN